MSFRIDDILKKDNKILNNNNNSLDTSILASYNKTHYCHVQEKDIINSNLSEDKSETDRLLCSNYLAKASNYLLNESSRTAFDYFCCGSSANNNSNDKVKRNYYYHPYSYQQNVYHSNYYYKNLPFSNLPLYYAHYSKRRSQVRFSPKQTDILENKFLSHKYLSPEDRRVLADSLKLSDRQVKTWFQNRRAKWRRNNTTCTTTKEVTEEPAVKVKT